MDKNADKHSIDELFARKLGNASLPTSADGFERLQARMQPSPNPHVVIWRNPAFYRYGAAAACLLLAVLFGRLYLFTTNDSGHVERVASRQSVKALGKPAGSIGRGPVTAPPIEPAGETITQIEQPGKTERVGENGNVKSTRSRIAATVTPAKPLNPPTEEPERVMIVRHSASANKEAESSVVANAAVSEQLVAVKTPTTAPAERVLVVTIAEPEALVAARKKVESTVAEKNAVASVDKATDEHQPGKLWQQVRRIKSGDVFARTTDGDDEHGLLNRAYSGLKRSIDKDKSTSQ